MSSDVSILRDLPLNFPQTFLPERSLLVKLLGFAGENGSGDKLEISHATGIPTGKSTGKVEPMIHYASGMGLIQAKKSGGYWHLGLTPLGHLIQAEDPYLSEQHTLWLMHLMLCRRLGLTLPALGIADAWFMLFTNQSFVTGLNLQVESFFELLKVKYGEKSYLRSLAGLVIRCYQEESCLGSIEVLSSHEGDHFQRLAAPDETSFYPVYACYLFLLWDELFVSDTQIALDYLSEQSFMFQIMKWDDLKIQRWLGWMSDKGFIQVDRYTGSPMLLRLCSTDKAISLLYSELV